MRGRSYTADVDAISVDASLGELRTRLDMTGAPRLQLVDVIRFVEEQLTRLRPRVHAVSFVLDVLELYDQILTDPFDPAGLDPQFLEQASVTLENLGEENEARKHRQFPVVVERLFTLAACQYNVAGSNDDVVRVLALAEAEVPQEPGSSSDRQSWLIGILGIRYPQQVDWTRGIVRHMDAWDQPAARCCHFPAVLQNSASRSDTSHHGFLRRLTLDIRAFSSERDLFSLEFAVGTDSDQYLKPVLTAGRTVLAALTPDAARHSFRGGYGASVAGMAHTGRSAGLAMASLFISEAQHFSDQRLRCVMSPGTVLTGVISDTGRIKTVAPDTLAAKIEAVFFSPAKNLVLPLGQLELATRHVRRLHDKYPRRTLTLLGKESLTDVFSDRRVVSIHERGRITHAAVRFWQTKWAVSAVTTAVLFMAAVLVWNRLALDMHPTALDISEAGIRLLNENEDVIWRKDAAELTVRQYNENVTMAPLARNNTVQDFNADGYRDALWIEHPNADQDISILLNVLDGRTLKPMWEPIELEVPVDYPYDVSISDGSMQLVDLTVVELTGDNLPEVVLALQHRSYYPAVLTVLDPRTGEMWDGYHHAGALANIMVADLDNTFPPEILAVGTNNAYDSGVLVVLDANRIAGSGPATGMYRGRGGPTHNEVAYLKFPITPLAEFTGLPYAEALRILVSNSKKLIRVHTRDLRDLNSPNLGPTGLRWEFDFDLRPILVGSDDHFDNAWGRALQAGIVDQPVNNDLKIDLMRQLRMWTEDGWTPVPFSERANVPARIRHATD